MRRGACGERGGTARAPELWACALRSGGERAPLRFYFPVADHVENNNSLGPGQRQLVLLGAPSAATGSSARGSRARLHPQQCALDSIRARCAAQRRPAPRTGSAERRRATRSPLLLLLCTLCAGMPCCPQAQAEASIRTDVVHQTDVCWSSQSEER
ncbi:uncharacterized protein LOC115031288 [Mus caroli]|uniref:Uncharacterized protein LOC115031288 n=1 Tax=Mus caroli TaxID=10089 RepID=A0A6P7RA41_MUSCR|nr:uncharacterized protein LOC115031288 [Mus caroli]